MEPGSERRNSFIEIFKHPFGLYAVLMLVLITIVNYFHKSWPTYVAITIGGIATFIIAIYILLILGRFLKRTAIDKFNLTEEFFQKINGIFLFFLYFVVAAYLFFPLSFIYYMTGISEVVVGILLIIAIKRRYYLGIKYIAAAIILDVIIFGIFFSFTLIPGRG